MRAHNSKFKKLLQFSSSYIRKKSNSRLIKSTVLALRFSKDWSFEGEENRFYQKQTCFSKPAKNRKYMQKHVNQDFRHQTLDTRALDLPKTIGSVV